MNPDEEDEAQHVHRIHDPDPAEKIHRSCEMLQVPEQQSGEELQWNQQQHDDLVQSCSASGLNLW